MTIPTTDKEWKMALMDFNCLIPNHMHEGLRAYCENHRQVGSFLEAVLSNDLYKAVTKADTLNKSALANYVIWLRTYAPSESFGSEEAYEAWTAQYVMPAESARS